MTDLIKERFRKDLKYKAIIDKAISGDRVVSHIYFDDGSDVELVTLVAGIKTPRSTDLKTQTAGEPFGDDAKKYMETRIVGQKVFVQFIGVSSTEVPIVKIFHPYGNIAEKILIAGLAEISDWQSSMVGSEDMTKLREAEKKGKASGKYLWKSLVKPPTTVTTKSGSTFKLNGTIEGTIARVVSPDTYAIDLSNGTQQLVHLTSIRSPRSNDSTAAFLPQAREFVRKYVGKKVSLYTDAFRNENPLVTITLPNGKNLAETVVVNGYATVIRHRRGDEDRSNHWDALIEAEEVAKREKKGIHSPKIPAPEKFIEASQDVGRARVHLRTLQSKLKMKGYVDFVISPNRVRIVLPRDGIQLVLVFAGLAASAKDSPISQKAIDFNNKKILQRDVTIDVFDVDKVGGFIGNIFLTGENTPYQLELVKAGLVKVHEGSAERSKYADAFFEAEDEAVASKLGVWENYDPEEEERKEAERQEKLQAKWEQKHAKTKTAFDSDDDEEDLSNLPEAVRKLVIKH